MLQNLMELRRQRKLITRQMKNLGNRYRNRGVLHCEKPDSQPVPSMLVLLRVSLLSLI